MDDTQRAKVREWIQQGMKLSEVQNKIISEFGLKLTYMEVRFLVDDLKVTPVDPEPAAPAKPLPQPPQPGAPAPAEPEAETLPTGGVSVTMDHLARPGALVSGKVVFSDGMKADWSLDEAGRLGLSTQVAGYRPSQADVQQFQMALQKELAKMGL